MVFKQFNTRLRSLNSIDESFSFLKKIINLNDKAQIKKEKRLEISLKYSSNIVGFLHASLIEINKKYYLLAGPSNVGKTTYSDFLINHFKGKSLANDWIAIEKDENNFYVSDLNFEDEIRHKERCLLSGIFFLTKCDKYYRDAYSPNLDEYNTILKDTFDNASHKELDSLIKFWLLNKEALPFVAVVPTKMHSQSYIEQTLINLFEQQQMLFNKIGVIGLGSIGAELSYQLGQMNSVQSINLYTRSSKKSKGYAIDMNQAVVKEKGLIYSAKSTALEVFAESEVVFLCFRDMSGEKDNNLGKSTPERYLKESVHVQIMNQYAQLLSKTKFKGIIFVITNPVDWLTYILYSESQKYKHSLRTYQVYGLGLDLDLSRAIYFSKKERMLVKPEDIKVYGNHSDEFILTTPMKLKDNEKLMKLVKNASPQIRKYIPRTVFGPVSSSLKSLIALQKSLSISLTTIQEKSFFGRLIKFDRGLPSFLSSIENEIAVSIFDNNKHKSRDLT
jgi:malate/lactate dehydrogenase